MVEPFVADKYPTSLPPAFVNHRTTRVARRKVTGRAWAALVLVFFLVGRVGAAPCPSFASSYVQINAPCDVSSTTVVNGSLYIEGPAGSLQVIVPRSGANVERIFDVVDGGNLTIVNLELHGYGTKVSANTGDDAAGGYGGIVRVVSTSSPTFFEARNSKLTKGHAWKGGGALYASGEGTVVSLNAVSFTLNSADSEWGRGGAINVDNGATVSVHLYPYGSAAFEENEADHNGGAICAWNGGEINLFGIPEEAAGSSAWWTNPASLSQYQLKISKNKAVHQGGAIAIESNGRALVRGALFLNNEVNYNGGALAVHTGFAKVEGAVFDGNLATHITYSEAGGIWIDTDGRVVVVDSQFTNSTDGPSNRALRTMGPFGHSVTMNGEAKYFDRISLRRYAFGKNFDTTSNKELLFIASKLEQGQPVGVRRTMAEPECSAKPSICSDHNFAAACSYNATTKRHSVECQCKPGQIKTPYGCLLCPQRSYSTTVDATECLPCAEFASKRGSSSCAAEDEVVNTGQRFSLKNVSITLLLLWGSMFAHTLSG
jgi:predicted outer membrane repeat protein